MTTPPAAQTPNQDRNASAVEQIRQAAKTAFPEAWGEIASAVDVLARTLIERHDLDLPTRLSWVRASRLVDNLVHKRPSRLSQVWHIGDVLKLFPGPCGAAAFQARLSVTEYHRLVQDLGEDAARQRLMVMAGLTQ